MDNGIKYIQATRCSSDIFTIERLTKERNGLAVKLSILTNNYKKLLSEQENILDSIRKFKEMDLVARSDYEKINKLAYSDTRIPIDDTQFLELQERIENPLLYFNAALSKGKVSIAAYQLVDVLKHLTLVNR